MWAKIWDAPKLSLINRHPRFYSLRFEYQDIATNLKLARYDVRFAVLQSSGRYLRRIKLYRDRSVYFIINASQIFGFQFVQPSSSINNLNSPIMSSCYRYTKGTTPTQINVHLNGISAVSSARREVVISQLRPLQNVESLHPRYSQVCAKHIHHAKDFFAYCFNATILLWHVSCSETVRLPVMHREGRYRTAKTWVLTEEPLEI